ncbi:hypothetical protein U9M48_005553 [Paspalum notatum var. saurae]|uniref:Metallothionein-like protein n=1 Tax=Paspalum notatum var. saurae TaxID=547442 RepID=A0AAQ3PVX3_PASNO
MQARHLAAIGIGGLKIFAAKSKRRMSSCCGGNCGCGTNCKCGSGCTGCKMDMGEQVTPVMGVAPSKGHAEGRFDGGAAAAGAENGGCKCNPCTCSPCTCKHAEGGFEGGAAATGAENGGCKCNPCTCNPCTCK